MAIHADRTIWAQLEAPRGQKNADVEYFELSAVGARPAPLLEVAGPQDRVPQCMVVEHALGLDFLALHFWSVDVVDSSALAHLRK